MPVVEVGAEFDYAAPTPGGPVKLRCRRIDSSNIEWIGWPRSKNTPMLVVQFKGGARYCYIGVSRQRAVACAYAKSSGEYLNKQIKPHYEVVKIR
jgi:hypothetical protein